MFENIGKKLKKIAVIVFIFGIIFSVTRGIMFMKAFYIDEEAYVYSDGKNDDTPYLIQDNSSYTKKLAKVDASPYLVVKNPDYVEAEDQDGTGSPYLVISNPEYTKEVEDIKDKNAPYEIVINPKYAATKDYKAYMTDFLGLTPITVVDGRYVVNLFGLFPIVAEESDSGSMHQFILVGVSVVLIGVALSWLAYLVLAGLGEVVQRAEDSASEAKKLD